jgi:hypothetical protein
MQQKKPTPPQKYYSKKYPLCLDNLIINLPHVQQNIIKKTPSAWLSFLGSPSGSTQPTIVVQMSNEFSI